MTDQARFAALGAAILTKAPFLSMRLAKVMIDSVSQALRHATVAAGNSVYALKCEQTPNSPMITGESNEQTL
jgi:hypothetical protein